jgi:hypothetical protein
LTAAAEKWCCGPASCGVSCFWCFVSPNRESIRANAESAY